MKRTIVLSSDSKDAKRAACSGLAGNCRFSFSRGINSGVNISIPSNKRYDREEIKRLLAQTSVIRDGCDLDLLVFFYRHPRTLLTSEQIAAFVGRDMNLIAGALDRLIAAGLVERLHNPTHAARLYVLAVHGTEDNGLKILLELASTRQGRHQILETLNSSGSRAEEHARRLRLMKRASA